MTLAIPSRLYLLEWIGGRPYVDGRPMRWDFEQGSWHMPDDAADQPLFDCPCCAGHAGYQIVTDPETGISEQVDCWCCNGTGLSKPRKDYP